MAKLKLWMVTGILGIIWGIVGLPIATLLAGVLTNSSPLHVQIVHYIVAFPTYLALTLGFHFVLIFIGSPLVGLITGILIGYLIEKLR
ncbi:MAG: hypothetical protein L6243_01830 [Candidatus Altiarchaeales archaeon]|nr:hypothetical protein [Candidatus Altiarchaeota archaeon]MBU4342120.1 hypothetical protein [Candidatus Altiarchaeota archaeon]MCG2782309.1 hypothetical protein [Candidatus Altiarchaeales archaeon]MCG2825822.1 hypothetical protein [Thermoplasmatales archaeon]